MKSKIFAEFYRRKLRKELRRRFPWLETDEDANGGDQVDALADWYEETAAPPDPPAARRKRTAARAS